MVFSPVVVHSVKDAKEDAFRAVARLTLPWLDLCHLNKAASRPVLLDSGSDVALLLKRFWFGILNRFKQSVARAT